MIKNTLDMFAFRQNKLIYLSNLSINHFGELKRVSGKLLSDFWSTSPKFDHFCPEFRLI